MTWKFRGTIRKSEITYILEALKTEGYWSTESRELSIQNKDVGLLDYLEKLFRSQGLKVKKCYLVKIKPVDQKFGKEDVIVNQGKKFVRTRIEYSPFDKSKKIVFNLQFKLNQKCGVKLKDNYIPLEISYGSQITSNCKEKSFVYLELKSHAIEFIRLLENLAGGKGAHKIVVTPYLWGESPEIVMKAFGALVDCEGTLDFYSATRRLRIRMINKKYLDGWRKILLKHGVESTLDKNDGLFCLTIQGLQNFQLLNEMGFTIKHSLKSAKWSKILSSYVRKQLLHGSAESFYLNKIKELDKPVSASDLAKINGKSKRVVNHYLTKLIRKSLISADKTRKEWLFYPNTL